MKANCELLGYARAPDMAATHLIMLTLTVLLASVPVAPPMRLSSVPDAAAVFALLLDAIKAPVFRRLGIV